MMLERIQEFLDLPVRRRHEIANEGRIIDDLYMYLDQQDKPREPDGCFHASALGTTSGKSLCGNYLIGCQRLLLYQYVCMEGVSSWEPNMRMRLDAGTALHEVVQRYLEGMGASDFTRFHDFKGEIKVSPADGGVAYEFEISSATDGLYKMSEHRNVLEIKTISDKIFHAMASPKRDHLTQAMVYMACLDIPVANLFYISFEPQLPLKEYMVQFDPKHWRAITDKIDFVRECVETGRMPKREGSSFFCRNCQYKSVCLPPPR